MMGQTRAKARMASEADKMREQTTKWLATLPNSKKNPRKMQMVFVGGKATFIPVF